MTKLQWDQAGERFYETGTDRGVLYPRDAQGQYGNGVAWNGLTAVNETPSGAEETKLWADNQKYLSLYSAEEFGATVEAYTYPDEWAICDGSAELAPGVMAGQQARRGFGLAFRTILGNDELGEGYGYKIHLIYGGMASPSQRSYATVNDSPDAVQFSWEITTTPVQMPAGLKPSAILTITSAKVHHLKLEALEDILYGTAQAEPRLPMPTEVLALMQRTIEYTEVSDTTGKNPAAEGWYELVSTEYVLTTDTTPDEQKTYYTAALAAA